MKRLAPDTVPFVTTKSEPVLATMPVGLLGGVPPLGGGIVTTSDCFAPLPS